MSQQTANRGVDVQNRTSPFLVLSQGLLTAATLPYRRAFNFYTWKPLRDIRATNGDGKLLIPLVKAWKADKYDELQSVQVAATFCGGAVFSSLSWTRYNNATWIADALWFGSLVCSIFAITTSIQTKSMLDDLPSREQLNVSCLSESEVRRMQRAILRYKNTPGIKHWIMVFVWQFPSMTMAYAWCTFIAGLTVYLCSPFIEGLPWQDRHKIAIIYLAFSLVGLITYISATIFVYAGEKDYERSNANLPASMVDESLTNILTHKDIDSTQVEAEVAPHNAVAHTATTRNAISSVFVDGVCLAQAARAKVMIEGEHSEAPRKETARPRRLLY